MTRVSSIINEIATIAELVKDSIGLFGEVDLKTNMVDDIRVLVREARDTTKDGNDGDKVDEGSAIFLVIEYTSLALLISAEVLLEMGHSRLVSKVACVSPEHVAVGGLEEATVAANDLVLRVASKTAEGWGAVDNGMIESADINDDERACKIDRAEMDTRMRAIGDAC